MGLYFNSGNASFYNAVNSRIYVDKTRLLEYTNSILDTEQRLVCVSRPRRFGKTLTADMLTAYYCKGCEFQKVPEACLYYRNSAHQEDRYTIITE